MSEKYFILSVDYSSRVGLEYMSNRLYYVKEMSYEEISDELQLPLGTVKAQLFRAREFLFNIMKHSIDTI